VFKADEAVVAIFFRELKAPLGQRFRSGGGHCHTPLQVNPRPLRSINPTLI
jgi:hypothetical protein